MPSQQSAYCQSQTGITYSIVRASSYFSLLIMMLNGSEMLVLHLRNKYININVYVCVSEHFHNNLNMDLMMYHTVERVSVYIYKHLCVCIYMCVWQSYMEALQGICYTFSSSSLWYIYIIMCSHAPRSYLSG